MKPKEEDYSFRGIEAALQFLKPWVDWKNLRDCIRPTHEELSMRYAMLVAQRSTCLRLQVGCVIASADFRKVISMGYNGNATGLRNGCDSPQPGACGCLHAEDNAVINCDSPRGTPKIIFCTHLPCKMCAKRFVNLGDVRKVYYAEDYRVKDGLDVLMLAGIKIEQMVLR